MKRCSLMLAVFFLSLGLSWPHVYRKDSAAHSAFPEIQKAVLEAADVIVAASKAVRHASLKSFVTIGVVSSWTRIPPDRA
jgi:hypothetical protein